VVDASVVVGALASENGFKVLGDRDLIAPRLMWSEVSAVVHAMVWRKSISRKSGEIMLVRLTTCPVKARDAKALIRTSWELADSLGWAKTYDAEYLALAKIAGCKLVTIDLRLRNGADRTDLVVTPDELLI